MRWFLVLLIFVVLIPTALAVEVGRDGGTGAAEDRGLFLTTPEPAGLGNTTIINTNRSDFWDNLDTPSDIAEYSLWYNHTSISFDTWGEFWYNMTDAVVGGGTCNASGSCSPSVAYMDFDNSDNFTISGNLEANTINLTSTVNALCFSEGQCIDTGFADERFRFTRDLDVGTANIRMDHLFGIDIFDNSKNVIAKIQNTHADWEADVWMESNLNVTHNITAEYYCNTSGSCWDELGGDTSYWSVIDEVMKTTNETAMINFSENQRVQFGDLNYIEATGEDILVIDSDASLTLSAPIITISGVLSSNGGGDIGESAFQFGNLFIDGTGFIDSLQLTSGSTVSVIRDEDDMSSDSATSLATQQSIKKYVDDSVVGGTNVNNTNINVSSIINSGLLGCDVLNTSLTGELQCDTDADTGGASADINDTVINVTSVIISDLLDCDVLNTSLSGELQCDTDATGGGSSFVGFHAQATSDQTISTGSYTTISFSREVYDEGNNFASNTFTAPETGKYLIMSQTRVKGIASSKTAYLGMYVSGQSHWDMEAHWTLSYTKQTVGGIYNMTAGDTAYAQFWHNHGSNRNLDDTYTEFFAIKVD